MILVFGTGNVLVTADEIMIPREDVNVSSRLRSKLLS